MHRLTFDRLAAALSLAVAHAILASWGPVPRHLFCPDPPRTLWIAVATVEAAQAGVEPRVVLGKQRRPPLSTAQHRAWARLRGYGYSWSGIGRRVGRDHSSVMMGVKQLSGNPG
jgi:hypothetical protein